MGISAKEIFYLNIGSTHYLGEAIERVEAPTSDRLFWIIYFIDKRIIYTTEKVTFCFEEKI